MTSFIEARRATYAGVRTRELAVPGRALLYGQRSAVDWNMVEELVGGLVDMTSFHQIFHQGATFKAELDAVGEYGGIDVPMTVIHGARDRVVPVSASRILHEANPGSRLVVIDHSGHCPHLDAPRVIARTICELAKLSADTKEIS